MRNRGFTIIEGLIASVFLAAAVVGVAGLISASAQQAAAMEQNAQGLTLARQLLEEICAKPFQDPQQPLSTTIGRDFGETTDRIDFDDIDDYHGWTDTSTALVSSGAGTVDASGGKPFARSVTVRRMVPAGVSAPASDFALVTVVVTTPGGQQLSLSQLMTRTERISDLSVWN